MVQMIDNYFTKLVSVFITKLVSVFILVVAFSGCINDDYSNCPAMSSANLRVTYYNQTVNNTFAKEVTKVDFFIFNENGLFFSRVTDTEGPFTNDYQKNLELPFGNYRVLVWANLYDDTRLSGNLQVGVSTVEDVKINLVTTQTRIDTQPGEGYPALENFVAPIPATQFYGETDYSLFINSNVGQKVNLVKNTKDIHVIMRWKNYEGFYDYSTEHQRTTRAYVVGSNGDTRLDNKLTRERNVTYLPFYRDPSDEDPWWGQTAGSYIPPQLIVKEHVSVLPDFRLMRLTADGSTEKLIVTTLLPDGTEKIVYARSIVDLIRLTGHYNTQMQIDQTNDYIITVDFRCVDENHQHGSTWIASTIWVNGWVVKDVDSEI